MLQTINKHLCVDICVGHISSGQIIKGGVGRKFKNSKIQIRIFRHPLTNQIATSVGLILTLIFLPPHSFHHRAGSSVSLGPRLALNGGVSRVAIVVIMQRRPQRSFPTKLSQMWNLLRSSTSNSPIPTWMRSSDGLLRCREALSRRRNVSPQLLVPTYLAW